MVNSLKINELRMANALTQKELALKAGLIPSTLGQLHKHKNPKIEVIVGLCKVFGCTPNDLIPVTWPLRSEVDLPTQQEVSALRLENEQLKNEVIQLQRKLLKKEEVL